MFHPKYTSNLHCNAISKCVISEKPNKSKQITYVNFAHERLNTQNHMSSKSVTHIMLLTIMYVINLREYHMYFSYQKIDKR